MCVYIFFFNFLFFDSKISSSVSRASLVQFNKKIHCLLSESMDTRQKVWRNFRHGEVDYSVVSSAIATYNC